MLTEENVFTRSGASQVLETYLSVIGKGTTSNAELCGGNYLVKVLVFCYLLPEFS